MSLSTESQSDVLEYIRGVYKKIQSFQIDNLEESKKLLEDTLGTVQKFNFENLRYRKQYTFYLRKLALAHFRTVNYKEADYYTELLFNSFIKIPAPEQDPFIGETNILSVKQAIEYNKKIFSSSHESKIISSDAFTYNNLGNILIYIGDYNEALTFFEKALNSINSKNLNHLRSTILQNISIIHLKQKNYAEALNCLNESIKAKKLFDDAAGTGFCTYLTGKIHYEAGNYEEAAAGLHNAFNILNSANDYTGLISSHVLLAKAYIKIFQKSQTDKNTILKAAKQSLKTAKDIAKNDKAEPHLLLTVYKTYIELYEAKGNFEKANKFLRRYNETEKNVLRNNVTDEIIQYRQEAVREKEKFINDMNTLCSSGLSEIEKIIQENEKQRKDFFGNIIHDLKNPIGNIKQLTEYLISDNGLSPEENNEFKLMILESAEASLGFVTKLLDNSTAEHNETELKITRFDINEEIQKLIKFYTAQTGNKSIEVELINKLKCNFIESDKDALMNILDNLFSNAIKFSPKNKKILISLTEDNGFLKISVKDEGPGFSEEDKDKLFKEFSKLSARPTAGEHSSGLGLSIVKKLVDFLQGTIEAGSEKGNGANMIVRIPMTIATAINNFLN
jgi:signal transduction histidine kinase